MSKHSNSLRKECILGHWTTKYTERLRLHSYYFSPSLDEIFEASTHHFHQYFANKIGTRQYNINLASRQTTEQIPTICIPAIKNGNTFCISISHAIPQYTKPLPKTFSQFILQQPLWIQDLTKHHKQNMEVDPLFCYIISSNSLIISTDGTTQARKAAAFGSSLSKMGPKWC